MRAGLNAFVIMLLVATLCVAHVFAQDAALERGGSDRETKRNEQRGAVRSVTIPVVVRGPRTAELQIIDPTVLEDGEPQQILSMRVPNRAPLTLAVLVQDDVVSSIGNEINTLASFIRDLPSGSRVLVGYLRSGSLQVRQRFTTDLDRAARALRIPVGSPSVSPYNPYVEIIEALKRFESQPVGRRAVLVVSDGLDLSRGISSASPSQSIDLQRAINEAQRRSTAIYSFYVPTVGGTANGNSILISHGQGSLARLSDETGGRAFYQGTGAPVSFDPFIRELRDTLSRLFALTYLSTHPDKGFHRIKVLVDLAKAEVDHPAGYTR